MGIKVISILILVLFSVTLLPAIAQAKTLPQSKPGSSKPTVAAKSSAGSGITVSPVLKKGKKALVVYFSNLQNAKSVSYVLTYTTKGQEEGAMGSLNLNGISKTSTELLFGTCSKNVCTYHTGITNMRLEVTYTSTSGKKYIKRYKIKV